MSPYTIGSGHTLRRWHFSHSLPHLHALAEQFRQHPKERFLGLALRHDRSLMSAVPIHSVFFAFMAMSRTVE